MTRTLLCLSFVAIAGHASVQGHHSFAASYLEDQIVSVEGDVVELEYRNPHSWVHIQARDNFGRMQKVSAEWGSPVRLNQQGITRDALKPGDHVIISGSPSRNPADYSLHLKKIVRPADGWQWAGRGERR